MVQCSAIPDCLLIMSDDEYGGGGGGDYDYGGTRCVHGLRGDCYHIDLDISFAEDAFVRTF